MPPFYSGDIETPAIKSWRFTFDESNYWLLTAIQGALGDLSLASNWITEGDATQEQAAQLGEQAILSLEPTLDLIGLIFPFAGDSVDIPEGTLLCDGASYLRTDFPDLFATIGTVYGAVDGTHFSVPNLQHRTVVMVGAIGGSSTYALGDTFGEDSHQLVTSEIPSHSHTDTGHTHSIPVTIPVGTAVPPPLDAIDTVSLITSNTGVGFASIQNTGEDGQHENRQPSIALNYVISAVH